jgi:HEAT repeat protein
MRGPLFALAVSALFVAPPGAKAAPPLPEKNVQQLIRQLKEGDPLARQDSAGELGKLGLKAADAVPALMAALPTKSLRGPAAAALAQIGLPAVPALVEALERDDFKIEDSVEDALAQVGRDAVPALVEALRGEQPKVVQWKLLSILRRIGPPAEAAIPALLEKLHDRELRFSATFPDA